MTRIALVVSALVSAAAAGRPISGAELPLGRSHAGSETLVCVSNHRAMLFRVIGSADDPNTGFIVLRISGHGEKERGECG